MPFFQRDNINLYYEEFGQGFPVLLFAPGGMRSAIRFWESSPYNPIDLLKPHFRVIAMDQRNAGQSTAPVAADHGWHSYTEDHLALLDHLGIQQCHVLGGCIGGPYCFGVMQAGRVAAAVLQQTIGAHENRDAFYQMFDSWADDLKPSHPEVDESDWAQFRSNMYDGEFVYVVDRDFVAGCTVPMLVLMGNDLYHPKSISLEICELSDTAELVEHWSDQAVIEKTCDRVTGFLLDNTPT